MTRRHWQLLETVFAADVSGALNGSPRMLQTRSKLIHDLERDGLVEHVTETLPGRFAVTVEGWALTALGHMTYCEWAAKQPGNEGAMEGEE